MKHQSQHITNPPSLSTFFQLLVIILLMMHCIHLSADSKATIAGNKYDSLGIAFANAINDNNIEGMEKLFDFQGFTDRIADKVFDSTSAKRKGFMKGFTEQGGAKFLEDQFVNVFQTKGYARYLRRIEDVKPVVRIDYPQSGHEYVELFTALNSEQSPLVVDMLFLTSGKLLSTSISNTTQMLLTPSESIIKNLFGVKEVNTKLVETFKEITDLRKQGKLKEVYEILQTLPDELKQNRMILELAIQASSEIGEAEYQKQLALLDKYHGKDDTTAFILIDHHFFNRAYNKADESIDSLINRYGKDGALLNLKANIAFAANDMVKAREYARQAVLFEPSFEESYWTLATIYTTQNQYEDLVSLLKELEAKFGYAFTSDNFIQDEFYAEFITSDEFKSWLN